MNNPINNLKNWNKTDNSEILIYTDNKILELLKTDSSILTDKLTYNLSANTDVNFTLPLNSNEYLVFNNNYWINSANTGYGYIMDLNDLDDVNLNIISEYSFLYYNIDYWINLSITSITNNLQLDSDCLKFLDNTKIYKPFETDKTIILKYDNINGDGSSIYPSRKDHNHDNLYSKLNHNHNFTTIGYTGSYSLYLNYTSNNNKYATYTYYNGLIIDKNVREYIPASISDNYNEIQSNNITLTYHKGDSPYNKVYINSTSILNNDISTTKYFLEDNESATINIINTSISKITIIVTIYPYNYSLNNNNNVIFSKQYDIS